MGSTEIPFISNFEKKWHAKSWVDWSSNARGQTDKIPLTADLNWQYTVYIHKS